MSDTSLEKQIYDMIVEKMDLQEIVEELPPEKLTYDSPLFESLDPDGIGLDSVAVLELVVLLKDHFDITVQDEDMEKLTTVSGIAAFVREHK